MNASLSFESTRAILELLEGEADLVLIGGQALNYWCDRYRVRAPDLAQHGPFTSKDVDLQGSREVAARCAERLGGNYRQFQQQDMPAFLGAVTYETAAGVPHEIDFLGGAYGLDADEVRDFSIEVEIDRDHGGPPLAFRIMHPVHCLESRANNVDGKPDKYATPHGLKQLRASIVCAREFIRETAQINVRAALGLNERVFEFACGDLGLHIYAVRQIDVFEAVLCDSPLPEKFRTIRYPQMKSQLSVKRSKIRSSSPSASNTKAQT